MSFYLLIYRALSITNVYEMWVAACLAFYTECHMLVGALMILAPLNARHQVGVCPLFSLTTV